MSDEKRARLKEWLASGEARLQPLSLPQRELWEATPVPPGDAANHICCIIKVRGKLTAQNCPEALQTRGGSAGSAAPFDLPGQGRPLQMIRKSSDVNLRLPRAFASARRGPRPSRSRRRRSFASRSISCRDRSIARRCSSAGPEDHVLVFAIHHAIADGWTLGVFVQDLACAYARSSWASAKPLPPVPLTYTAWGAAERAYWQPAEVAKRAGLLEDHARRLAAPLAERGARRSAVGNGALGRRDFRRARRRRARAGAQTGATLFTTLLAAFQVALARWSGVDDLVVGTPVANRNKQAVRETMGYFAGIVPLRGHVEPGGPLRTRCARCINPPWSASPTRCRLRSS